MSAESEAVATDVQIGDEVLFGHRDWQIVKDTYHHDTATGLVLDNDFLWWFYGPATLTVRRAA